ncbi:thioredoxin family protein [Cognaticolwellia mytili]|uniref:thioredoxin family protein n=1 Tax=Cognaticolwellia mytili TaxID=1888913 RepID=UPI000A170477|nr:thioredoxin family protein [Cognaticolwellia mytili]
MRTFAVILFTIAMLTLVSACANSYTTSATMTIGEVSSERLISDHPSFMQSYRAFQLSESDIAEVKAWPSDLHVDVYFGTWCHDSQREVPHFLKIVAEKTELSNRLIGLDYEKSEPNGTAKSHDIKYTPTFVVYQNNKEIGRIVERPKVSLAADISAML